MKFNVVDLQLCADAIHRGGGQIIPASRRLYYGLQLLSQPTLVEPIFSCEITATSDCLAGVYQTLNHRRGIVLEETPMTGKMSLVLFVSFRSSPTSQLRNRSASQNCSE